MNQKQLNLPNLNHIPPELGPRIVFFTGGTALRSLSQALIKHTYNSVHLITPFDSGGSSAILRQVFNMPAVGDIRNRLLALADPLIIPPAAIHICNMRLNENLEHKKALYILYSLANGTHPDFAEMPRVLSEMLRVHLRYFIDQMPDNFNLCGASIGNLILTGGYLHHKGVLGPTIGLLSKILQVRGTVLPIVNDNLHLGAYLQNKDTILGQHNITGRAVTALPAAINNIFLTRAKPGTTPENILPCKANITPQAGTLLRAADIICYPMGSFYTSMLANILPSGVGKAIADAKCPKIYIPNTGQDPEQSTISVADQVNILLNTLNADFRKKVAPQNFLNAVLIDKENGHYPAGINEESILALGIKVYNLPIVRKDNSQKHAPENTITAILNCIKTKCLFP